MTSFEQIGKNKICFVIDTSIYNENVISKVLYWLIDLFFIERKNINNDNQQILLEKKKGLISETDFVQIREKLSQDFIDFKTRDIVNRETQNIRDILYVKAFANNDDFEDYNLMQE